MLRLAIIGRPNVGKSTLFNRLVGKKAALVYDEPGVTRDRQEELGSIADLEFILMDTAGLDHTPDSDLQSRMTEQTLKAIEGADLLLFVVDAISGITPNDTFFARLLRRTPKPIILLANKCEGRKGQEGLYDAFRLGIGQPIAISAEHGIGMDDLYTEIKKHIKSPTEKEVSAFNGDDEIEEIEIEPKKRPLKLAIVGRPNAGKSTFINKLLKEERLLTGPEAGITRDAISIDWHYQGRDIKLFDTAGLRRKARISEALETLSTKDTLESIQYAEIVILMVDALQPLDKQDLQIARHVIEEGRALVIALNKWDLIKNKRELLSEVQYKVDESLNQARGVSIVPISGMNGDNLPELIKASFTIYERWNKRIPTGELNRWLTMMIEGHSLPLIKGRRLKIKYMTQMKMRPPTFAIFISQDVDFPVAYERYLMNGLREEFGLEGVPLRFYYRKPKNPYAKK